MSDPRTPAEVAQVADATTKTANLELMLLLASAARDLRNSGLAGSAETVGIKAVNKIKSLEGSYLDACAEVDRLNSKLDLETQNLLSITGRMIEFLNQQRPLDALGRARWTRMKTACAVMLRRTEVEPGEIICDFCGTTLERTND